MSESNESYDQANAIVQVRRQRIDAVVLVGPRKSDKYVVINEADPGTGKEILCRGIRFLDEAEAIANALNELSSTKESDK